MDKDGLGFVDPEGRLQFPISIVLECPVVLQGKKQFFKCCLALSHCGCHQFSEKVTDKCDSRAVACCVTANKIEE